MKKNLFKIAQTKNSYHQTNTYYKWKWQLKFILIRIKLFVWWGKTIKYRIIKTVLELILKSGNLYQRLKDC